MIHRLPLWLIFLQIFIGLFSMGYDFGVLGNISASSLLITIYGLLSWFFWNRVVHTDPANNTLNKLLEHFVLLGLVAWCFHTLWGSGWRSIILTTLAVIGVVLLILEILRSQYQRLYGSGDLGLSSHIWSICASISLTATNITLIGLLGSHASLSATWLLVGWTWIFIWKLTPHA